MRTTRPIPNERKTIGTPSRFWTFLGIICFLMTGGSIEAGEWANHQDNITSIRSRISQVEEEIEKVTEVRKQAQTEEEVKALMKHLLDLHDELELEKNKLHEEVMHARFRHPEQGMSFQIQYPRSPTFEVSAPQPSSEFDDLLDQVRLTMEIQYGNHRVERYRPRVTVQDHFLLQKKKDRERERIVLRK